MTVVFSAENEPAKDRDERWRHVLQSTTGRLEPRGTPDRCVAGQVGAVQVLEMHATGLGGALRTPRHVSSSDPELCKIDVVGRGAGVVEQGGRQAALGPGDLALVDLTRPASWAMSGDLLMVAVVFPRRMLPISPDEVSELVGTRLGGGHGAGALLSGLARQLPSHLGEYAPHDGARLGTAVLDLLAAALVARLDRGDRLPRESRRRALLAQIHAFMERRLGDPGLTPATIAAENYISVRYLHKLFEGERATVGGWIRRRRLERCRRDLLDPAFAHLPVAAVGERWGFQDPAHFNRAFKRGLGVPPAEYRRTHAAGAGNLAPAEPDEGESAWSPVRPRPATRPSPS